MLHTHIAFLRKFYISGFIATSLLLVLAFLFVFPMANSFSGVQAASVLSETTLTMTTTDIALALSVDSATGTFRESDSADFSVTTNNFSGYTLSIHAAVDDENYSKLVNGNSVLNSISSASSASGFNNGNWGYKPSKVNSTANESFQPAPTYEGTTLDTTNAANNEANTYGISIGAKADYGLAAGKYSNTFVITAIANPVSYAISYSANTEDQSVANMPSTQTGDATDTSITLADEIPTRTGYTFTNWCLGTIVNDNGIDTCDGTTYAPESTYDTNQTEENVVELLAMWSRIYTVVFDANSGTGTMPNQSIIGNSATLDANLYTYSGHYFNGWNTEAAGTGTSYADEDTFAVPATGTSTILYAQWEESIITFDDAFAASRKNRDTTTNKYKMQDMNDLICDMVTGVQNTELVDTRDGNVYHVGKQLDGRCWMEDTLNIDLTDSNVQSNLSFENTNASDASISKLLNGGRNSRHPEWPTAGVTTSIVADNATVPIMDASKQNDTPDNTSTTNGWKTGTFYNICAASAGTWCYDNDYENIDVDPNSLIDVKEDICPAGWRLPTGTSSDATELGEYNILMNLGSYSQFRGRLHVPLSGYRDVDTGNYDLTGTEVCFWTSTISNSGKSYRARINKSESPYLIVGTQERESSLINVRCVAKDHVYMQDVDKTDLATILPNDGDTTTLYDRRDETSYTVGKLADDNYWMLDNLALDPTNIKNRYRLKYNTNGDASVISSFISNVAVEDNTSVYDYPRINTDSISVVPTDSLSTAGGWKVGVYYNFCAASLGTYCYASGSGVDEPGTAIDAEYDICPAGWRMPTGGTYDATDRPDGGEYQNLYDKYNDYTDFRTAFRLPLSGYYYDGSVNDQNDYGQFWSSTYYDSYNMYYLYADSSNITPWQSADLRLDGQPVRCLAK